MHVGEDFIHPFIVILLSVVSLFAMKKVSQFLILIPTEIHFM